ncbi:MAG: aminotransferase class III-fold pyridoxal phosphate-dependent enzyme [Anaerolineales bacterium]|nr:aminotransferase class III-fold pyridoxal phosphate-dependent enzyme [Anaerolineales bacterium]
MSILDHAPVFSLDDAVQITQRLYHLHVTAKFLSSERDQNFLLQTENGERFVLKIANATEERIMLEAQNEVMGHLAKHVEFCPKVVPTKNGEEITSVQSATGAAHFVRLVTHLPGTLLGNVKRHSDGLLYDLGFKIGQLTAALQDFDHPALHRDFHWDLANGLGIVRKNGELIEEVKLRETVFQLASAFEKHTAPLLLGLRQSVVHNDANDYNLLAGGGNDPYTKNQSIVGLIDFGDMVYSYTVGDLAVAIAYAALDKPDPLTTASQIVKGYHAAHPLEENELAALFGLVTMRLCMSVCIAAEQQASQPDNAYLGISQSPIRNTLPELAAIHPRFAEAVFRDACGLTPFPANEKIVNWLESRAGSFASPLDFDLHASPVAVLDLSVSSPLLSSDPGQNEEPKLTPRVEAAIEEADGRVGIGRYDEARYFYTSPAFATGDKVTDEYRTIHLGIDLFAPAGTPVYAPLAGTVYAFADNNAPQDYGPVIILEHKDDNHLAFYTLYGHLNRESLDRITLGQRIGKGKQLATIGESDANGGWTPHLHFQVIADLLELGTDFPGVARPSQRDVWKSLCPDPNLILGIPEEHFPLREPDKTETLGTRRQRLGRNLSISYRHPLKIVRGWKQYLFDDEGHKYLDAYNNVAHVGHSHPRVVAAARQQIGILNTNTRYLHDFINRYAEKLTALLPDPLSVCFFVNSGSEANELALRLARTYTGQRDLIVLDAAYHGNTNALIDISPYKHNGPGGTGTPDWAHVAPIPDDYRGAYKRDDLQAGAKYARHILEIIERMEQEGRGLAGYIAESLPSVGGQIILPPGYLADAYRYVREAGGVCIADEVQTGFGRIGAHFWGFELQDVIPDIVVLGKPIGNGHPLAAVITTPEIADAFNNGMEFFSTFGGNPVSCAVGLEVLDVVLEEKLQEHALRVGKRMLDGLRPFVDRYPIVGDVRGSGLFLGVELVRDRETLEPATEDAAFVANRMREHGILLGTDGPYHNVIKIRPPMPFDEGNADFLVDTMEKILDEFDS